MKRISALFVLILLFSVLLVAPLSHSAAYTPPPEVGPWIIEDNTTMENENEPIVIHGDVIIRNDGVLTLKNCVLEIAEGHKIEVEETGTFCLYDSTIKKYRVSGFYRFNVYGKLVAEGSDISGISGMFNPGLRILDNGNV